MKKHEKTWNYKKGLLIHDYNTFQHQYWAQNYLKLFEIKVLGHVSDWLPIESQGFKSLINYICDLMRVFVWRL